MSEEEIARVRANVLGLEDGQGISPDPARVVGLLSDAAAQGLPVQVEAPVRHGGSATSLAGRRFSG